ncbi:MAG: imidazole glycerol phosphate synthase subunit HisH [Actinobacteria bacterium]|nr:imidazole glycerol phosphate synthase subunit HisH [Actinomycetota bacterium]NDA37630.1 imidazole glycerol phosphate synthase subunit HisH [Acidimicrobiia bacterium]NDC99606.1 imidazole glycerol phosphate synthase subunit HisH [bacterium]HBQ52056.1 imidazole glycerol phosphate synthase subunit HisH [Acidimicrobium sp.]NBO97895.1 imidazole glycerol phosphate synthase subunit HisH [Actinomycetota bacterium]
MIAVLDYGIGNLRSAQKGLQFVGADAQLTNDKKLIAEAHAVVLPGVGNFGACMTALREADLEDSVHDAIDSGRPFLGICVGMQMLFDKSEESPGVAGLGIVGGEIKWLPEGVQRPQMQWNRLNIKNHDVLFAGLSENPWMYFVHSLSAVAHDQSVIAATCSYGSELLAAVRVRNIFATQFHPEKSAAEGLQILENFVNSCVAVAPAK